MQKKTNHKLNKLFKTCSQIINNNSSFLDKKIIIGLVLGITIAAGTSVIAQENTNANIISSISNFFGVNSDKNKEPSKSAINEELIADAKKCAEGQAGTLGAAIKNATKIHLEIAAIAPPVEELFDGDCFSGLLNIFDLSFAIPSLSSIMAAVTQAVIKFAQKKVCRAIQKASSMLANPINNALGKIGVVDGVLDANGMLNGMVQKGLDSINPELGNEYLSPRPQEVVSVDVNPFKLSQTSIENGAESSSAKNNSSSNSNSNNDVHYGSQISGNLYNSMNALNSAQQTLNQNMQKIIGLNPAISQAQQRLISCNANNSNISCEQAQNEVTNLVNQKNMLEAANTQIQTNISSGAYNINNSAQSNNYSNQLPSAAPANNTGNSAASNNSSSNGGGSWLNSWFK